MALNKQSTSGGFFDTFTDSLMKADEVIKKADGSISKLDETYGNTKDAYNKAKDLVNEVKLDVKGGTSKDLSPSRSQQKVTDSVSSVCWFKRILMWFFGE